MQVTEAVVCLNLSKLSHFKPEEKCNPQSDEGYFDWDSGCDFIASVDVAYVKEETYEYPLDRASSFLESKSRAQSVSVVKCSI